MTKNGGFSPESGRGFSVIRLDSYGGEAVLTVEALADMTGTTPDAIQVGIDRKELPAPFELLGRRCWTQQQLRDYFEGRGSKKE